MKPSLINRLQAIPLIGLFFEKSFIHYAWTGVFISAINVALLWLLIDIAHIPTVVSSVLVIGGTFLLRYLLFRLFNVL